jgi:Protein of unknown function (DUF2605)
MQPPSIPESELLKSLLEPIFDDFDYWLARSESLLRKERLSFLAEEQQNELLQRVQGALKEVTASRSLFRATQGQVGVEPKILMTWHRLIGECWSVAMRFRANQQDQADR